MTLRTQKHVTLEEAHPHHNYKSDHRPAVNAEVHFGFDARCPLCRKETDPQTIGTYVRKADEFNVVVSFVFPGGETSEQYYPLSVMQGAGLREHSKFLRRPGGLFAVVDPCAYHPLHNSGKHAVDMNCTHCVEEVQVTGVKGYLESIEDGRGFVLLAIPTHPATESSYPEKIFKEAGIEVGSRFLIRTVDNQSVFLPLPPGV